VQGQPVDSRSDLFAVGIVLYQLLTAKRPFDGENDFSIIHQIIGHEPTSPSTFNPQLPAELDAVVSRALAKKRDDRFATARDFAVALQAAIRRATDQTIVPPANTGKQEGGVDTRGSGVTMGSTTSGTSTASATSTNTSTVTQELELVYWKDIKDSVEPEEIEGFLVKFPTGIYADLARRRLKKLASGAGEATMGSYGSGTSISSQDMDATRMRDFSRPLTQDNATSPGSASGTGTRSGDYTRTMVQSRVDATVPPQPVEPAAGAGAGAGAGAPAAAAVVQPPAGPPAIDPRDAPTIPPVPKAVAAATAAESPKSKSGIAKFALIGVAAVAVLGVILKMAMGSGAAPSAQQAASAAVVPAVAAASQAASAASQPAAAMAASAASGAAVMLAAASSPAKPASMAASAPRLTASQLAARAKPKASAPPVSTFTYTPSPAPEPVTPRVEARTAPAAAITPAPAPAPNAANSPRNACEDRMLIGFQICMAEQCARPVFQTHPLCVERRDMERRRRESQQNN